MFQYTINGCHGNGLELPGSEINCYKCQGNMCMQGAMNFPGLEVKCALGVFSCRKFYGGDP